MTAFSQDGKLLATGGTDSKLTVLNYPSLRVAFPPVNFNKQEIYDLDFDPTGNQARYELLNDQIIIIHYIIIS